MDLNKIWEVLKGLCKEAETVIPGKTGKDKEAWCVDRVCEFTDWAEYMLGIAAWANLPVFNGAERWIISLGVKRAFVE
ncbi:MAG TPA: hypothetical protein VHN99_05510, partial [Deinococcales bacterium]|nr:hypothetical protein [Deinococcales bacterium]